jgi:glucokinase
VALGDLVRSLIADVAGADEYPPDRIGLGVQVTTAPGYGPSGAWDDFPLREQLQKATALPAVIENGRLIHGVGGQAGEIGHLVVQPGGRTCRCGNQGCLDSMASTVAIPEVFDELAGRGAPEASDLATVIRYFEKGDKYAAAAIDQAGDALCVAISTLLRLINPERLVLFGPAGLVCESSSPAAERFMSRVRESGQEHASSAGAGDCTLVPKVYDDEIGARAAAAVALLRAKDRLL